MDTVHHNSSQTVCIRHTFYCALLWLDIGRVYPYSSDSNHWHWAYRSLKIMKYISNWSPKDAWYQHKKYNIYVVLQIFIITMFIIYLHIKCACLISVFVWWLCLNIPPSAAYMCQRIRPALVQIMACRLFSAKPLSKQMLGYCQLDSYAKQT